MAGVTTDIHTYEYGVPENNQLVAYGLGANVQVYSGEVAILAGTGSTTTQGYLKSAVNAGSASDIVVGVIEGPAGGTQVATTYGVLGGTTDGAVWVNVRTGAFYIQSGTGSNALSASTNGKTVYYGGENTSGPIANATQGTTCALGIQLPQDPGINGGSFSPGSSYYPIKLNTVGGP
jgi:hypothetical protein